MCDIQKGFYDEQFPHSSCKHIYSIVTSSIGHAYASVTPSGLAIATCILLMQLCTIWRFKACAESAALQASDCLASLKSKAKQMPALSDLFSVGQLVKGVVIGAEVQPNKKGPANSKAGKKTIHLSLTVSKVNAALTSASIHSGAPVTACVTSEEDHGYTVVLGNDVKGFLSKRALSKGGQQGGPQGVAGGLKPGMLVECMAQGSKGKAGKTVKVTADPSAIAEAVTDDYEGLNIGKPTVGISNRLIYANTYCCNAGT